MTLNRREKILVLAWSLPDALRSLAGRSGDQRRLAPTAWALCAPCDGTGETRDRWGAAHVCQTCRGAGRYRTDPYADGEPVSSVGELLPAKALTRSERCDRCDAAGVIPGRWVGSTGLVACPSCDGTGHLTVPIAHAAAQTVGVDLDSETWAWKGGDWDALDSALEAMRCNGRRPLWRAFVAAYVEPPYRFSEPAADGLGHVEAMMPTRVRVPEELVTAWRERAERQRLQVAARAHRMGRDHRKREIRAALKLGHSTAEVARMFAVSEATVRRSR